MSSRCAQRFPSPAQCCSLADDKNVPLTADADGWLRWKTTLKEGFTFAPILTESRGLTNRRAPKCQVTVYPDKPPAVKVVTPDDKLAVRPDDTIQIAFTATDDVGIGMAELLVYDEAAPAVGGEPVPIAAIPIPLGDQQGARSVQDSVDLDLSKFVVEDGSELSYEIRVREDRGGAASQTSSQPSANQQAANQQLTNQSAASQTANNQPSVDPLAASGANANSSTASTTTNQQSSATSAQTSSSTTPNSPGARESNCRDRKPARRNPRRLRHQIVVRNRSK